MNLLDRLGLPLVRADLVRFEGFLADSVSIGDEYLDSITTHLINAGGKRLRPMLAIASATAGASPATDDVLLGGVSLELVHLASLYHDDVLDEASVRRNVDSVNARYGNLIAIVAGDYLMARSAAIAADLGTDVAGLLARTLASLTRGQISEVRTAFSTERTEADYYEAVNGKTASLMATSCGIGAMIGRVGDAATAALTEFGRAFGVAYQLRDDVLDVIAVHDQLGKPAGQDLAEGIYNLPTLFALKDPVVGDELREVLGSALDDHDRERARKLVVATDGVSLAVGEARAYAARADESLVGVADEPLRAAFSSLTAGLLEELPG